MTPKSQARRLSSIFLISLQLLLLFNFHEYKIGNWLVVAAAATSNAPILFKTGTFSLMSSPPKRRQTTTISSRNCRNVKFSLLIRSTHIRGGGSSSLKEEEENYDSEDEDFEIDNGFDDDVLLSTTGDDFDEGNIAGRALDIWKSTPPFTKAYLSASMIATAFGYVFSKNREFPKILLLEWKGILHFQLWRPFTAFLNFGPFGFGYLMTGHFVWTYMSTLERLHHDKPYDFWVMIMFGCITMVAGYSILGISPRFLGHNLSTFLVYIWSRYHEGMEVNIMELFNARAEMLPWYFLAQTALLEGELPLLDLLGIVFGHIYHHCKVSKILVTPKFLVEWYHSDNPYSNHIRNQYKLISEDFEM